MNTPVNIETRKQKNSRRSISDLYKELEKIGHENHLFERTDNDTFNRETNQINAHDENQTSVLQGSLKVVYLIGQCLGLYPVTGFLEKDVMKMRFSFFTCKFLYSLMICFFQITTAVICYYRLIINSIHLSTVVFMCFYTFTSVTSILYIALAARWPGLMLQLTQSRLDDYTDTRIKCKCIIISVGYLALCIVLQIFRAIGKLKEVMNCGATGKGMLNTYIELTNPWIFELNIPYNRFTLIFLIVLNIVTFMIWFYSDLFLACVSLFLASILRKINEKIISSDGKIMPSTYWQHLREDYNRITTVIRSFDDVISCLIFSSFANSLFFICLQLYYILSKGVNTYFTNFNSPCPNISGGPFNGYEHSVYLISLITFLVLRFLFVALCISEINSASLTIAPSLYKIPSSVFCKEVQRFIDQIHEQMIALSGWKFFFVTRELIFSIFSTIITYELVLFQFSSDPFRLL